MSASNRASLITKTHKVLKKHYQPASPPSNRTLFEHLLYACCLENAPFLPADDSFSKLQELFFDWNEVRVTTIRELADVMSSLPDAVAGADRLRRVLQSVFETHYTFDLEFLKKENIGVAVKKLTKLDGVTPFCVSYVTQAALGGHAIAVDKGVLDSLFVLGVISEAEAAKNLAPGMERAIPKTKGIEFASLLHQLGADYLSSPFSPRVRSILLEIAPDAKERFPKRVSKKASAKRATGKEKSKGTKAAAKSDDPAEAPAAQQPAKEKPPKSKKSTDKTTKPTKASGAKKKSPTKRLARKKPR